VQVGGNTQGSDVAFQIKLRDGLALSNVKIGYLNGKADQQGEIGVGYSLLNHAPLIFGGINLPYAKGSVDLDLHGNVVPSLLLDSQRKFDEGSHSCEFVGNGHGHYFNSSCTNQNIQ
jgi:hypothetical protein